MKERNSQQAGLVIAGGRSRRFGEEKAAALLEGRTLLARARDRLAIGCGFVAVNARVGGAAAAEAQRLGVALVAEPAGLPDGPLSGVLAGLIWARDAGAEILVTVPCDAPLLPADVSLRLLAAAQGRACAVARTPDGIQSLCAAWRVELIAPLEALLMAGEHPAVQGFLTAQDCGFADYPDAGGFLNINTPQDLAEAERRLAAAP